MCTRKSDKSFHRWGLDKNVFEDSLSLSARGRFCVQSVSYNIKLNSNECAIDGCENNRFNVLLLTQIYAAYQ